MSDINISLSAGDKKRLLTGGKYCPDDIVVEAVGGGDTDAAFEAGRKAEYDAFWDAFQRNGEEYMYYGYMFANRDLWTQEAIEKVKYKNLKVNYVAVVFSGNTSITDLSMFRFDGGRAETGVKKRHSYSSTFSGCKNLVKCMEIDFDTISSCPNMFSGCTSLEVLPVTGILTAGGLNLSDSTKLNKTSIASIVNALSGTTSDLIITLSKTAVETAFTDAEWSALIATKNNWTISLA